MSDQGLTIRSPRDVIELVGAGIGRGSSIWIPVIPLGGIFTDAHDLTLTQSRPGLRTHDVPPL